MTEFKTFEEIKSAYPLDQISNTYHSVKLDYTNVITDADMVWVTKTFPFGWFDKTENKWCFYVIESSIWYNRYVYDGKTWWLGIDTWDGIIEAEEPEWGIKKSKFVRHEQAIFKTLEEAEEYRKKKWDERLEF